MLVEGMLPERNLFFRQPIYLIDKFLNIIGHLFCFGNDKFLIFAKKLQMAVFGGTPFDIFVDIPLLCHR